MSERKEQFIPIIEKINKLRIERGWSINYLAMEAGLTQSTLNNMYKRNAEPKISTLRALCRAFNITLAEFFDESDKEECVEKELQRRFNSLTDEQKRAVLVMLRSLK